MIRELRIYLKLRPYIKKLKEQSHMKFSWNLVLQVIATGVQAANALTPMLPEKQRGTLALVVGVLQSISALIAHYSNPDGTPAAVAYLPTKK